MNYLIKSNFFIFFVFFLPALFFIYSLGNSFFNLNTTYLIIIFILEGFIFKVNYDFLNIEHDHKYFVHMLPKKVFYFLSVVFNVLTITTIILLTSNFKWLLFIGLLFSNLEHILYKKNMYFGLLIPLLLFPNFFIIHQGVETYIWWLLSVIFAFGLIYYLKHKKVRVYYDDNY